MKLISNLLDLFSFLIDLTGIKLFIYFSLVDRFISRFMNEDEIKRKSFIISALRKTFFIPKTITRKVKKFNARCEFEFEQFSAGRKYFSLPNFISKLNFYFR